jgi:N-acetylmuramoyl-L-alanine amidase
VDGGEEQSVDLYAPTAAWQQYVWNTGALAAGAHSVVIRWLGERNGAATGTTVGADAFDVIGTLTQAPVPPGPRDPLFLLYSNKTRVIIDLPSSPTNVTAAASGDGYLTVDYTGVPLAAPQLLQVDSSEVDSAAVATLGEGSDTVRIFVDLARYQRFRVMSLAPSGGYCHRIIVDVYTRTDGAAGDGPPLICVDPGHGGSDPGATGTVTGTPEKTINLSMGLFLADRLRANGFRVLMTRTTDVTLNLHDRPAVANAAGASLFISVHNNWYSNPAAYGTETYYKGTTETWDPEGKLLAQTVQRNLLSALGSLDHGAKTHPNKLVVLNETNMTAILTEAGFLSNAAEEAKLLTTSYQQAYAQGACAGIMEYLDWTTAVFSAESTDPDD